MSGTPSTGIARPPCAGAWSVHDWVIGDFLGCGDADPTGFLSFRPIDCARLGDHRYLSIADPLEALPLVLFAQVEAFVEIARQGTMRRAAEALAVSQPVVTVWVQGLEAE